jgi:hydroxyacyl-ACP dehydratase HTD2-like protein with hotdog domain
VTHPDTAQPKTPQPEMSALLDGWAPGPADATETITAGPAVALASLFDVVAPVTSDGDPLPPLWHWLYFLDRTRQSEIGPDGHPAAGRFMPPIPERRRMYAGGRVSYLAPIRCGDRLTRRSELAGWRVRQGRTGELLFVTIRHTFVTGGEPVAIEEQDLVYRSGPPGQPGPPKEIGPAASPPHRPAGRWRLEQTADPVLLFRFSALTYNAHRIHYDAEYARTVEGHDGLVVHGPLLALLCLELPRRHVPDQRVSRLSFRARAALYAGKPFTVSGARRANDCELRVTAADGTDAMTAEGSLAP